MKNGKFSFSKIACMVIVFCTALVTPSRAQRFRTLVNFDGTDGFYPELMSLVQGTDGDFYGTTSEGGVVSTGCPSGCGTVFKISREGKLTTLHSFNGADGSLPYAGLVQATNGDFYGTTESGGANGYGTIFKMTADGALSTLHSFNGSDGSYPYAGLVQAADGKFYGTTVEGGASNSCVGGCGTVFQITPGGRLTTLYSFCSLPSCTDGWTPTGGLVQANSGDFYGTTESGGANNLGTVFQIAKGIMLMTLHSFNGTDGSNPLAGLVQSTSGDFFGTTTAGGAHQRGAIFKISAGGRLTTLHSFDNTDGYFPDAGLLQATDGSFYGTTYGGGAGDDGTVFKIDLNGKLTTLHSFHTTDGSHPAGGLLQGTDGAFYGATPFDGLKANGTVFGLSVGLGPFVVLRPSSGKVGATIKILGTDLTGTSSVTFNGKVAEFNVTSKHEITTEIPTGATTGKVKVKTPSGWLISNAVFRVGS